MNSINVALSRRHRHERQPPGSLLRRIAASGYEDAAPLTTQAVEGEHPRGRELSMAWLAGTVMTGLTSVLLMGAALYVSFQGQENFSTASEAMLFQKSPSQTSTGSSEKADRPRPVAQTRSDIEVIKASIRELVEGPTMIRSRAFVRVDATLATSATPLAENIPEFDASALIASLPVSSPSASPEPRTEIYSTNVEGEVAISTVPIPTRYVPAPFYKGYSLQYLKNDGTGRFTDETSTYLPGAETVYVSKSKANYVWLRRAWAFEAEDGVPDIIARSASGFEIPSRVFLNEGGIFHEALSVSGHDIVNAMHMAGKPVLILSNTQTISFLAYPSLRD